MFSVVVFLLVVVLNYLVLLLLCVLMGFGVGFIGLVFGVLGFSFVEFDE